MVTDYTSLVAAVVSHTDREDLESDIDRFIQLTEALMRRRLRTLDSLTIAEVTTSTDTVTLPDNVLTVKSVKVDGEDALAKYAFSGPTITTTYERRGDTLVLDPEPEEEVTVEVTYQASFLPLSSVTSNWIIEEHPDAYFYGTVAQAYAWLKDPEAGSYAALFDGILDDIQTSRMSDKYGSAPLIPRGIQQVAGVRT